MGARAAEEDARCWCLIDAHLRCRRCFCAWGCWVPAFLWAQIASSSVRMRCSEGFIPFPSPHSWHKAQEQEVLLSGFGWRRGDLLVGAIQHCWALDETSLEFHIRASGVETRWGIQLCRNPGDAAPGGALHEAAVGHGGSAAHGLQAEAFLPARRSPVLLFPLLAALLVSL